MASKRASVGELTEHFDDFKSEYRDDKKDNQARFDSLSEKITSSEERMTKRMDQIYHLMVDKDWFRFPKFLLNWIGSHPKMVIFLALLTTILTGLLTVDDVQTLAALIPGLGTSE